MCKDISSVLARKVLVNNLYHSSSVLLANFSGLIVTIYLARILKPESFGEFSLALAISFLLLSLTDLGINQTATRFIAEAYSKRDLGLVGGYFKTLLKTKILLSLFISSSLFLFCDIFSYPDILKIASLFIFFSSISNFLLSVFNAFNDFKANFTKTLVYETLRLLLLIFVTSAVLAMLVHVIAAFLTTVFLLTILRRYPVFGETCKVELKRILRFVSYLTLGTISWTVFAYVDTLMIAIFLPIENVGYYRVSYSVVSAVYGMMSVTVVLFPVFVQLEGENLRKAFERSFKYSAILAFPSAFGLIQVSDLLVTYFFGSEYVGSVPSLKILSILIIISNLNFWGVIFNAKEKPEYPVYSLSFVMLVNILLNYILIPKYGILGAAVATVFSNFLNWLILAYLTKKMFDIFFDFAKILKPLFSSSLMFLILENFKFDLILTVLLGILMYFTAIFAIKGLDREDYDYIKKIIFQSYGK